MKLLGFLDIRVVIIYNLERNNDNGNFIVSSIDEMELKNNSLELDDYKELSIAILAYLFSNINKFPFEYILPSGRMNDWFSKKENKKFKISGKL